MSSRIYLSIDFGSTYTKLTAIDLDKEEIISTARAMTTVKTNVLTGSNMAFEELTKDLKDKLKDYEIVKFTTLLASDFQAAIDKKEGTFIDVREAKDYEKGHVAGAKNIDVKNIDKDLAALLPADKNAPVYTYCYSGNRSSKAAQKAVELGYTNVYNAWDGTKEHEYKF